MTRSKAMKVKKSCLILVAAGALLVASAAALWASDPSNDEIRLGMVNVQSGPAAGLGKGMRSGAEAVFKHVNAQGGIHGRKITLLVADDGYEPDRAVDETLKMIEQHKVFSLFGFVGTPTANAALPIVKELDVPLLGLFTGAMTLRKPVSKQVFNVRASYDDEAEMLVTHFLSKGAKTVAVFYQDDGFGLAVLGGTERALKKRNMAVVAKGTFQRNTVAIKTGLAAMLDAKPDAIVMVGPYTPLAVFIKEARAAGLTAQLGTVSFVGTDALVAQVGNDGNGVVISQVVPFPGDVDLPITRECRDLIAKSSGEPLGFVNFEGCISARVMVAALDKAGRTLNRVRLIEVLQAMNNVDLGGITVSFSAERHQASDKVFLTHIENGKIVKIVEKQP